MPRKLYRSQTNRMVAGVCGGLGEYLSIDPVFIRLFFVLLTLGQGAGVLIYLILWFVLPSEGTATAGDTISDHAQQGASRIRRSRPRNGPGAPRISHVIQSPI